MNKKLLALAAFMLMFAAMFLQTAFISVKSDIRIGIADSRTVKNIYLTFDDGPSDRVTPKILDILSEEQVKATFFIVGQNAELRKYLIERESAEGHTVAIHSYTHTYKDIYSSPKALLSDIEKCNALIYSITGKRSDIYRFPGGSYGLSDKLKRAVTLNGYKYIDWNASLRDAEIYNATPGQLYNAAVASSIGCDEVVLLAHDSTTKTATVSALRSVIKYFKNNGYNFMTF